MLRRLAGRPLCAAVFAAALWPWAPASAAGAAACPDGVITEIFIDNQSVFEVGSPDLDARFNWAYRTANRLHVRTRPQVVRRALLFAPGDCYQPARIVDSERILRGTPYIADAEVFGVRQPDGDWHVVVHTRDEWSFRIDGRLDSSDGIELAGLEVREDNLLGTGQSVAAYFRDDYGERTHGVAYAHRQLAGTNAQLDLGAARTSVGYSLLQRASYPFRGEEGRWAFRQQAEQLERHFEFFVPTDAGLERGLFAERRRTFDAGGVFRLGRRGNLTLFGAGMAGEWIEYPRMPAAGEGPSMGENGPVGLDTVSSVRLVFLAGQRNVRFDRRGGLDAVRGAEDVVLGVEVELGIGRTVAALSRDDDISLQAGISVSGDLARSLFAGARAVGEGKRDFGAGADAPEWQNIFGQVDGWMYWRPAPHARHTLVAAASLAGGWRPTVPFQLTLGSRSGMRGSPRHAHAGGRRAVGTLEHRAYLGGPFPRLFDLGSAVFVDVGRTWAGDAPFGTKSPVEASAGAGLRMAFPAGSRSVYRMDVAAPLTAAAGERGVRFIFGTGQAVGRTRVRDDGQLERSSRRTLSASLFNFPD